MSFDLVLFGGTGDLAWRKLMPALFQAFRHGTLPPEGRIVGVARDDLSNEQYRALISTRFAEVDLAKRPSPEEFQRFAELLQYQRMDLSRPDDYAKLKDRLAQRNADIVVMYLATAPSLFTAVCEQIAAAGLNTPQTRLVLEKPLGHDLASNRAINETVRRVLTEKQVFRIDHYLGKPSVQNLFALRFGNALFEPLWRRETIANIQITIAEDLGVEKRGAFYDNTGALRDMVQNHALQLLCALAMEPPINSHADAIRDEKLKVLRSLRPWSADTLAQHAIRGQYAAGNVGGEPVPAYRDEPGVAPGSTTETFVALRAEIANWRWAGVPFYIRTGKRLAVRRTEIAIQFKQAPHALFRGTPADRLTPNFLVLHVQPDEGISLDLSAKEPGPTVRLAGVRMDFRYADWFSAGPSTGYETLLYDALIGDATLFQRADNVEAGWSAVQPALDDRADGAGAVERYAAGSEGPAAADALLERDGRHWLKLA